MNLPLDKAHRAAIEVLRGDLTRDPEGLRSYVLELLCGLAGADVAMWFEVGLVGGEPVPTRWRVKGVPDQILRAHLEERFPYPHCDPRLPAPHWNRRFVSTSSVFRDVEQVLYPSRMYQRVWQPSKLEDMTRLLVYHQGRLVAFVGTFRRQREPRFQRREVRRLTPLAEALSDALITADSVDRAAIPEEGCDVLLNSRGEVEFASQGGRAFLDRAEGKDALEHWVRELQGRRGSDRDAPTTSVLQGHRTRWSRLLGPSGIRYLVHLERVKPLMVHPGFELSRTQRAIARLVCAGASVAEISTMLDVSSETVRTHLRHAYRVLGVSSRAELVTALSDMPSEAADTLVPGPTLARG
jgi:DNA-binding CsgD family transcriptional regulator